MWHCCLFSCRVPRQCSHCPLYTLPLHLTLSLSPSVSLSMHLIRYVVFVFACGRLQMSQCARKSLFTLPSQHCASYSSCPLQRRQAQNRNQNKSNSGQVAFVSVDLLISSNKSKSFATTARQQ